MIDILYGTFFLFTYIILNINNKFKIFDTTIKQTFNYEAKKFYIVKTFYNFKIINFVNFFICIWINELVFPILIYNILNLIYFLHKKRKNYIYHCSDILLYVFLFSFSSLPINKMLSIFGICFTDFEILSNNI